LRQIKEKFNALGLRGKSNNGLAISNYQTILKNPIYTGLMRYNGELYEGKHEPIITKKLFDDVQEVMTRKSKPKTKELKSYMYPRIISLRRVRMLHHDRNTESHNYLAVQSVKVSVHRNMSVRRLSLRRRAVSSQRISTWRTRVFPKRPWAGPVVSASNWPRLRSGARG